MLPPLGQLFIEAVRRIGREHGVSMLSKIPDVDKAVNESETSPETGNHHKVKLEVYGEEMVEKVVRLSGNSGRVYLPPDWVGCRVKIIRLD
jgi:putative transposon-encoded protein